VVKIVNNAACWQNDNWQNDLALNDLYAVINATFL
jgi:hypothetical protein